MHNNEALVAQRWPAFSFLTWIFVIHLTLISLEKIRLIIYFVNLWLNNDIDGSLVFILFVFVLFLSCLFVFLGKQFGKIKTLNYTISLKNWLSVQSFSWSGEVGNYMFIIKSVEKMNKTLSID